MKVVSLILSKIILTKVFCSCHNVQFYLALASTIRIIVAHKKSFTYKGLSLIDKPTSTAPTHLLYPCCAISSIVRFVFLGSHIILIVLELDDSNRL